MEPTQTASKEQYTKPELIRYGSIREVTETSGSTSATCDDSNNCGHQKRTS